MRSLAKAESRRYGGAIQGAHRWVVPARRGCPVGSSPLAGGVPLGRPRSFAALALVLAFFVPGCSDEEQRPLPACTLEGLEPCESVVFLCDDDRLLVACDRAEWCAVDCAEQCASTGLEWSGRCAVDPDVGHDVCLCL